MLLAREAEALSSGRQLWSRGSAGAAVWKCDKDVAAPSKLLVKELWVPQDGKLKFIWRSGKKKKKVMLRGKNAWKSNVNKCLTNNTKKEKKKGNFKLKSNRSVEQTKVAQGVTHTVEK